MKKNTIPNKVHHIWLGKVIKQEYLYNIIKFANINKQHITTIYTDNVAQMKNSLKNNTNIHIKSVEDVFFDAKNNGFLNKKILPRLNGIKINKSNHDSGGISLATILKTEFQRLQPKFEGDIPEYAQLSDILRLLVLYLYGAVYLDCDFIIKNNISLPLNFQQTDHGLIVPLNNAIIATYPKNPELEKVIMNITTPFNLYTNSDVDTKHEIKHNIYKAYINAKKLLQINNLKYQELQYFNDIEIEDKKEFIDFTDYKIKNTDISNDEILFIKNNFHVNIINCDGDIILKNNNISIYNKDQHYLVNNLNITYTEQKNLSEFAAISQHISQISILLGIVLFL